MSNITFSPLWSNDIARAGSATSWLWDGLLADGNLTLLTSLWKSGKTTLIAMLLNRRVHGGRLLGQAVRPGGTVVISEEPSSLWAMRSRRHDFGDRTCFFCRPFDGRPDLPTWRAFIDHLLDLQTARGIDLIVIDPLALFLPAHEGSGPSLLTALHEVQRLTERGLAVLLLHHPPKGEPGLGQAARGSGVLPAFADILLEMRIPQGDRGTRRRRLHGFSRYSETPQHLLIELNPGGDDYTVLATNADDDALAPAFDTLRVVLLQSETPLTRDEIHRSWPQQPTPTRTTLWRWLTRGCDLGILQRMGAGSKCDPFRYGLANASGEEDETATLKT